MVVEDDDDSFFMEDEKRKFQKEEEQGKQMLFNLLNWDSIEIHCTTFRELSLMDSQHKRNSS